MKLFDPEESVEDHDAAVDAAAAVTPSESARLQFNLARDDKRDECEEALLRFLDEESESGARP